jgi:hypothetical protein
MDRRKRMHGKKRRSPAKMFAPMPQDPNAPKYNNQAEYMNRMRIFKPQGENATNYNPDGQASRMQEMYMAAQKRMQKQMQLQQPQGGGGGSHTHSVKVDGHSDSGGYQSPASAQVNPYKRNRGLFGSGLNSYDPTANIKTGTMAFMKKKLKKKK